MFVTIPTAGIFVGVSGFTGAFLANFTVYFWTRRAVFIGGHFCMMIGLLVAGIGVHISNGNIALAGICFTLVSY